MINTCRLPALLLLAMLAILPEAAASAHHQAARLSTTQPGALDRFYANARIPARTASSVLAGPSMGMIKSGLTAAVALAPALPAKAAVVAAPAVVAADQAAVLGRVGPLAFSASLGIGLAAVGFGILIDDMAGHDNRSIIINMIARGVFATLGSILVASVFAVPLTIGGLMIGGFGAALVYASYKI